MNLARLRLGGVTLAALALAGVLTACGAKSPDHPEELRIHVMKFLREIELKDYDGAAGRVHPKKRAEFIRWVTNEAEKVQFTNSRIRVLPSEEEIDKLPEDKPRDVLVIISLEYFRLPSTTVKKDVREQTWRFDEEYDRWLLWEGWRL